MSYSTPYCACFFLSYVRVYDITYVLVFGKTNHANRRRLAPFQLSQRHGYRAGGRRQGRGARPHGRRYPRRENCPRRHRVSNEAFLLICYTYVQSQETREKKFLVSNYPAGANIRSTGYNLGDHFRETAAICHALLNHLYFEGHSRDLQPASPTEACCREL